MQTLIDAFRQLVFPVPSPWRVSLLVVLAVLLIFQVGPLLIVGLTRLVVVVAEPAVAGLALPEYALSSWLRDRCMRPVPGTYGYGRAIEVAASAAVAVATSTGQRLGRRHRVRWLPTIVLAAIPVVAFYGAAALQNTKQTQPAASLVAGAQWSWLSVDGWVMTGELVPCAQPGVITIGTVKKPLPACTPQPRPSPTLRPRRAAR